MNADESRQVLRRLAALEREIAGIPVRPAEVFAEEPPDADLRGRLILEIPAFDWLEDAVVKQEWDAASNGYIDVLDADSNPVMLAGINGTGQPMRGDATVWVRVWGKPQQVTVADARKDAIEIIGTEIAIIQGFTTTTAGDVPQEYFHLSGERAGRLDGGPCETGA